VVELRVDRRHLPIGDDHVPDHERLRLLAHAAKERPLLLVAPVVDGKHRDHQVPRPVGKRVLHARELHVVVLLAQVEDHLGARVEPDHPGIRVGLQQVPGRLPGAHPQLEHPRRREGDRLDRGALQLVEAGDLGADLLQVCVGVPVELRGHARNRS